MKTTALLLLTISLSVSASPFWVQVSSIKTGTDAAPSFLKTIEESGFKYEVMDDTVHKKICIGSYKSYKEALSALPMIRCKIAFDAFIVDESSVTQPVAETMPTTVKEATAVEAAAEPLEPLIVPPKPCLCIYDAHMLHKMEIEDALAYYKASSFYGFKK